MIHHASRAWLKSSLALLALTAILFLALASACGGDDEETNGNEATPTKEAGDTGGPSTHNATPTHEAGNGSSSDATEKLKTLAGEYEQFEGYVKYNASDFGDNSLSSMAIYQKGSSSRLDIESSDGNIILINTPDATYMCTVAESQCIKYPAGEDTGSLADAFTSILDPSTIEDTFGGIPDAADIDTSSEKIAGIDAVCFSASGDLDPETAGDESGEVCFSESGLLLRLKFEGGGQSGTIEATEASSDVPGSAFEPPYDVIDLSDLGQ